MLTVKEGQQVVCITKEPIELYFEFTNCLNFLIGIDFNKIGYFFND